MRRVSVHSLRVLLRILESKKRPDRSIIKTRPPPSEAVYNPPKINYPMGQK